MANTVACPVLGLMKINGIDSSEDPTALIGLLAFKTSFALDTGPATNKNNTQNVNDDRRSALLEMSHKDQSPNGLTQYKLL